MLAVLDNLLILCDCELIATWNVGRGKALVVGRIIPMGRGRELIIRHGEDIDRLRDIPSNKPILTQ